MLAKFFATLAIAATTMFFFVNFCEAQTVVPSTDPATQVDKAKLDQLMPKPANWNTMTSEQKRNFRLAQLQHITTQLAPHDHGTPTPVTPAPAASAKPSGPSVKKQIAAAKKQFSAELAAIRKNYMEIGGPADAARKKQVKNVQNAIVSEQMFLVRLHGLDKYGITDAIVKATIFSEKEEDAARAQAQLEHAFNSAIAEAEEKEQAMEEFQKNSKAMDEAILGSFLETSGVSNADRALLMAMPSPNAVVMTEKIDEAKTQQEIETYLQIAKELGLTVNIPVTTRNSLPYIRGAVLTAIAEQKGGANEALRLAKQYVDSELGKAKAELKAEIAASEAEAKDYADQIFGDLKTTVDDHGAQLHDLFTNYKLKKK